MLAKVYRIDTCYCDRYGSFTSLSGGETAWVWRSRAVDRPSLQQRRKSVKQSNVGILFGGYGKWVKCLSVGTVG